MSAMSNEHARQCEANGGVDPNDIDIDSGAPRTRTGGEMMANQTAVATDTDPEDAKVLVYAGWMGHEFVTVVGEPGSRRTQAESNTIESAKDVFKSCTHVRVYRKTRLVEFTRRGRKVIRNEWQCVYDADK